MTALPPSRDDTVMWDIWQTMFKLPLVTVADEVGTFGALADEAMNTAPLAKKLGVDARALSIHLAGLASMGLLERSDGRWHATPEVRRWLDPDADAYWGAFLFGFRERTLMHGKLLETLKTGKRPDDAIAEGPEWEKGDMSDEIAQRIARFMNAHSRAPALGIAEQPEFSQIGTLMDVGCGGGAYSIEIARQNPNLKITLMDLAPMIRVAQGNADKAGLSDQISSQAVNMFEQDWPTGHDAHFLSNVFHDWSEETNRIIARKSFAALPSGGRIFLSEILMNDEGTGPWPAAAFSLLMLVGTLGKQYSLPELQDILGSAGFVDITARRHGGGYFSLVSARKP